MKLERGIQRLYEAAKRDEKRGGVRRWAQDLEKAFKDGEIRPDELSIRDLYETLVPNGREQVAEFQRSQQGGGYVESLHESVAAVNTRAFGFITGQMVFTQVMDVWGAPEFIGDRLVTTMPSSLMQESMPGVGQIGDVSEVIDELGEYPMASMSEEVVRMPVTQKRGLQVAISQEMVAFDRTGRVLENASRIAETLKLNKEKRILDVVFGIVNPYVYNDAAGNTYRSSGDFVNLKTSNVLADWTNIEAAELLFAAMTDPQTGDLVTTTPDTIVVPPALRHTAMQILRATTVRQGTDSGNRQRYSESTLDLYDIVSSPYVKQRTSSDTTWAIGAPKRAFVYVENDPITVKPRPLGDESFTHDIVAGWKVFERGVVGVREPRHMVKNTA